MRRLWGPNTKATDQVLQREVPERGVMPVLGREESTQPGTENDWGWVLSTDLSWLSVASVAEVERIIERNQGSIGKAITALNRVPKDAILKLKLSEFKQKNVAQNLHMAANRRGLRIKTMRRRGYLYYWRADNGKMATLELARFAGRIG